MKRLTSPPLHHIKTSLASHFLQITTLQRQADKEDTSPWLHEPIQHIVEIASTNLRDFGNIHRFYLTCKLIDLHIKEHTTLRQLLLCVMSLQPIVTKPTHSQQAQLYFNMQVSRNTPIKQSMMVLDIVVPLMPQTHTTRLYPIRSKQCRTFVESSTHRSHRKQQVLHAHKDTCSMSPNISHLHVYECKLHEATY